MKKRIRRAILAGVLLGMAVSAMAQIPPDEVADRAKWEDFLKTSKIVKEEQLGGSGAVTNPWVLTLEKDGITREGLWKNVFGRPKGYIDSWKYEIAAYEMDKLLGLNMVPPTTEIRFRGDRGSCQLWEESEMTYGEMMDKNITPPSIKKRDAFLRAMYIQRAFDNLIANEDRHQKNILLTKNWGMIFIDHSRAFRTAKSFTAKLIYTEKHREGPKLMKELPRALVEKIKGLTFESIKAAVGEYLSDEEINAVLTRRELILMEIDRLIKLNGEDKVLY